MSIIFLAGPIDYVDDWPREAGTEVKRGWRERAKQFLMSCGTGVYDPHGAFSADPHKDTGEIRKINLFALEQSAALLAAVFTDVPSWGTPTEIEIARHKGIPVVLWKPDLLQGAVPCYLRDLPVFSQLEDACNEVAVLCDGDARECGPLLYATNEAIRHPALDGDAGYDLLCSEGATLAPGDFAHIRLGLEDSDLRIAVPPGHWCSMAVRSSWASKGLVVLPTVIEQYRGPLYVFCFNAGGGPLRIEAGDRVAQMLFFPLIVPTISVTPDLPESERGTRGFGSTGRR